MLTIRLTRKGKKNQPFFKVVVTDKRRSAKGGRAVEELGYVNPLTKKNSFNKERVLHWIKNGAKPTPRIHNLLISEKIIEGKKINLFKKPKVKETTGTAAPQPTAAPAAPVAPQTSPEAAAPAENPAPAPEVTPEAPVQVPKEEPKS